MESGARIRRRVAALGARHRGARIPADLQREITAYARERRREGASFGRLAQETGISFETIRRYVGSRPAARDLVPVTIVPDVGDGGGLTLVSPRGYRVEGLEVATAVALLRELG